jgi:hypothetical protein
LPQSVRQLHLALSPLCSSTISIEIESETCY